MNRQEAIDILSTHYEPDDQRLVQAFDMAIEALSTYSEKWIPCSKPPVDGRNVFLAHGTNDFKSCCIGHYEHSMKRWYEDKNWFASPIYDCKYWCDIPELPDMGNKQFEMPEDEE